MLVPLINAIFMPRLPRLATPMTTRNLFPAVGRLSCRRLRSHAPLAPIILALAFLSGCATPGPLHLYTAPSTQPAALLDTAPGSPAVPVDIPTFLAPGETLTGLAYDPFTDHLFLRLAPGNVIRVVDRPARAIKRTFTVATLPATGGGDLAVRPRDGRIFFAHPSEPALVVTDRFGRAERILRLATLTTPPTGVAYDSVRNQLLVLNPGDPARITAHAPDGDLIATMILDRPTAATGLAYDPLAQEFYLTTTTSVAIFAVSGHSLRTLPQPAAFLDLGPRSLLRLF